MPIKKDQSRQQKTLKDHGALKQDQTSALNIIQQLKNFQIIDISPTINEDLGVFPGDTPFRRKIVLDFNLGHHLRLSSIQSTLHLGAHADSAGHYHSDGEGVDKRRLDAFIGPCQVVHVKVKKGERILLKHLEGKEITQERVLFFTDTFPNPYKWNSDFASLSPEIIHFLKSKKVCLVGIDTPSVDPEDSKLLESHQALFETKMSVLEGIVLSGVKEGNYFLSALPLAIENADASPVRAVLLKI